MTGAPPPRVHIVDDDELVRAKMSYLLSNHGYSTEIYSGGGEFFHGYGVKRGCILLDLCMPQMSGYDILERLALHGNTLPVVVLSARGDLPAVVRAMTLGAVDYIEKSAIDERLLDAISRALAPPERERIGRNVAIAAAARLKRLSPRQIQILQGLLDGLSNKGIAHQYRISRRTVEMHRARMNGMLGIKSLSEAVQFAIDAALVPRDAAARERAAARG